MDIRRFVLFAALALVTLMLFQSWQQYQLAKNPPSTVQNQTGATSSTTSTDLSVPSTNVAGNSNVNSGDVPTTPAAVTPTQAATATETTEPKGELIDIKTDLIHAKISTLGGSMVHLGLLDHPVKLDRPDDPFVLFRDDVSERYIGQSGLAGDGAALPSHNTMFSAEQNEYILGDGDQQLVVNLNWTSPEGVAYVKSYTFNRNSYRAEVKFSIANNTTQPINAYFYGQLQRTDSKSGGAGSFLTQPTNISFTGGAYYTPEEKYNKVSFDDMQDEPLKFETESGWVGMLQHYFVSAWLPPENSRLQMFAESSDTERGLYKMGFLNLNTVNVPPGQTAEVGAALFAGPKEQARLDLQGAPGLKLTVDYGWLTFIAQPLFWVMSKLHQVLGNWGWTIIAVTVLLKILFLPLSAKSYKSMAKMKKLAPRLKTLKERHGDDKQKYQQAMMELYKKEKVNPASGCLPILIQIPVFIALYWVLLESVEMRQAPWALWIKDLSSKDPYYILPVMMGGSMLVQQLLNPAPMDPLQQKIMLALPVVFTVFFLSFPAGLVLYWVVNNVLSIVQQWVISRRYA